MTKLGSLKYDLPALEFYISYVGLLRRLPTLVEQIWHSNLGLLFFDLPSLESVSLYPMLEFSLISHWFTNIVPINNQFISQFWNLSIFSRVIHFSQIYCELKWCMISLLTNDFQLTYSFIFLLLLSQMKFKIIIRLVLALTLSSIYM